MAKLIGTVMLLWLVSMPVGASAHDAYDDSQSHPLQLAAYALHPVGFALEWLVMRPIHFRGVPAEARAGLRARAAREPLRGLRAVSARVTLTRVLAVARMRDGSRHRR